MKIINFIIYFGICIIYIYNYIEIVYCVDSLTAAAIELQGKISKIEGNVEYWADQVRKTTYNLNALIEERPDHERNGTLEDYLTEYKQSEEAVLDCKRNLNAEQKVLNTLKSRLSNEDYNMDSSSSIGKRKFDGENNISSSSKR